VRPLLATWIICKSKKSPSIYKISWELNLVENSLSMKDDDESNDRLKFAKASVIESKGTILISYYYNETITLIYILRRRGNKCLDR